MQSSAGTKTLKKQEFKWMLKSWTSTWNSNMKSTVAKHESHLNMTLICNIKKTCPQSGFIYIHISNVHEEDTIMANDPIGIWPYSLHRSSSNMDLIPGLVENIDFIIWHKQQHN